MKGGGGGVVLPHGISVQDLWWRVQNVPLRYVVCSPPGPPPLPHKKKKKKKKKKKQEDKNNEKRRTTKGISIALRTVFVVVFKREVSHCLYQGSWP